MCIRDSALVGDEVKKLVLFDGTADRAPELVTVQERHLLGDGGRGIVEKRRGVHGAVLELLEHRAVNFVGARLGDHADMSAAVGALRGVVHGRVHRNLLDRFHRRSGERLADRIVDRDALDGAATAETLAGIEHEPILADLAGRVSVEQIIGADAVHRKTVAGVALSIGENGLIAQPGVGTGPAHEIRVHTGTHNRQLGEAAGCQGCFLNGQLVDHVTVGGIHLVHQCHCRHFDRGGHRTHTQVDVDGGRAVRIHQNFLMSFGVESFLGDGELIGAGRKIRNTVRPVDLRRFRYRKVGGGVDGLDRSAGHGCARRILYRAGNGAENLLGLQLQLEYGAQEQERQADRSPEQSGWRASEDPEQPHHFKDSLF